MSLVYCHRRKCIFTLILSDVPSLSVAVHCCTPFQVVVHCCLGGGGARWILRRTSVQPLLTYIAPLLSLHVLEGDRFSLNHIGFYIIIGLKFQLGHFMPPPPQMAHFTHQITQHLKSSKKCRCVSRWTSLRRHLTSNLSYQNPILTTLEQFKKWATLDPLFPMSSRKTGKTVELLLQKFLWKYTTEPICVNREK